MAWCGRHRLIDFLTASGYLGFMTTRANIANLLLGLGLTSPWARD
jgi:hypothetical protein